MSESDFVPHHINATKEDLAGNGSIGRYIFLPGSDGRAKEISQHFTGVRVRTSARAHNLYLGTLECDGKQLDVASVSTGMGTPSLDIVVNELIKLGGRRFLRVGTAGSLQKRRIRIGDLIVATGAVRDENTSRLYVPPEYPALASMEMVEAARKAASRLGLSSRTHYGLVHSKDSLFAREFKEGPMKAENSAYMKMLEDSGVLASEMESSHLFILASLFSHVNGPERDILAGTVLGIIGDERPFGTPDEVEGAVASAIALALETVRVLARSEL